MIPKKSFRFFTLVSLAAATLLPHFCSAQSILPLDKKLSWTGTWAAAPQLTETRNLPPAPGLTSNTLRQVVHVSVGGKRLRVRFSNAFGKDPVEIVSAHVAFPAGLDAPKPMSNVITSYLDTAPPPGMAMIKPESDKALTFQGRPSVTIGAGEMIFSDAFAFDLPPQSDLSVSIHFANTSSAITGHPGSRATSYLQAGNSVAAPDLSNAIRVQHWYILSGVDVAAETPGAAIVALGDSITDGRGSEPDKNNRWPDNLARRLQANQATADIGVLNQGIGGNCVLRGGLGPTARDRFDRDVFEQNGVRWLILLEGVNDIGGSRGSNTTAVASGLIAAFEQFATRAHERNIRIYGATILPFEGSMYFSPDREAVRQQVNEWIRTSGKFDTVIDFDAATRDPERPTRLAPAADSGDHLHPGVKGYQMMADAIDLKLFAK